MDWGQIIPQLLGPLGTLVLALVVIWTGIRKIWMFTWQHDLVVAPKNEQITDIKADRDRWRELALRGTNLATETVTAVRAVSVGGGTTT